jgi:uncharacterized protein (TIGR04222 family)
VNPLALPGPAFLGFYLVFCCAVTIVLRIAIAGMEGGASGSLPLDDPYQIAWLRGGAPEAVRIALLSLVDRGLLDLDGRRVSRRPVSVWEQPRQPLERAVYTVVAGTAEAKTILQHPSVTDAADGLRQRLAAAGLAPDAATEQRRWAVLAIGLFAEIGMALAKAAVALERGKQNLGFLLILMLVGTFVLWGQAHRRRTRRGDAALADLRRLFGGLKARARSIRPGQMTADAILLAAVFGLSALADPGFAAVRGFIPVASGSSSGSSCGSSGSSCSSGCGGGGGCGGCGS